MEADSGILGRVLLHLWTAVARLAQLAQAILGLFSQSGAIGNPGFCNGSLTIRYRTRRFYIPHTAPQTGSNLFRDCRCLGEQGSIAYHRPLGSCGPTVNPGKLEHGFWRINAGIVYLKAMRILMFQLSGFCYTLHLYPPHILQGRR